MPDLENSKVVEHILQTLINMSGRKTTAGHAVSTMNDLIEKLKDKYGFLKHIEINDTRYTEISSPVTVMADINSINSNELGKALYDIIKSINITLGKDAGHFFIRELRRNIGENYSTRMEDMGVDLSLMQLENEVDKMTKKL